MSKPDVYDTEYIFIQGAPLKKKIYTRTQRMKELHSSMIDEIIKLIKEATSVDADPVETAASVMVALEDSYNLGAHALSLRSFVARAAELQKEIRELSLFATNLTPEVMYRLTLEEGDRFGL